jgi:hypothetical protein
MESFALCSPDESLVRLNVFLLIILVRMYKRSLTSDPYLASPLAGQSDLARPLGGPGARTIAPAECE